MYQVVANAVHRILLSWWLYIQSIKPEVSILWVQSLCVELPLCGYDGSYRQCTVHTWRQTIFCLSV